VISGRRLIASVRSDLARAMAQHGLAVAKEMDRAVTEQAEVTKAQARVKASSTFGPRVSRTIGAEIYSSQNSSSNKPGEASATIFSRWIRKTGSKRSDIWKAYEEGAIIRPVLAKQLLINLATRQRRGFRVPWKNNPKFALVPLGQGRKLITRRGKKNQAWGPEAMLVDQVTVKKRIDFDDVRRNADRGLYERVIARLNRL